MKFCPLETRDVVLEPSVSPTMPPNGEPEKYKVKLVMDMAELLSRSQCLVLTTGPC